MKTAGNAPRNRNRGSGVVVPEKARWHGRLAAWLIWGLIQVLASTLRWRWKDGSGLIQPGNSQRFIFAVWHNRLSLSPVIYRRLSIHHGQCRQMAALVSASRDGGLLAHVLKLFEVIGVRGSSSRRGAQALRELASEATLGRDLAVTPDGPRGPKYEPQGGVIALAQITGLPILPVSYRLGWKWTLRSWDAFQIPLPFRVVEVEFAQPISVSHGAGEAEREEARSCLQKSLLAITRD
jgi:lysophospholipid acyltransferase (LPLAT)-like uncharacterized protein